MTSAVLASGNPDAAVTGLVLMAAGGLLWAAGGVRQWRQWRRDRQPPRDQHQQGVSEGVHRRRPVSVPRPGTGRSDPRNGRD